MLQKDKFYTNDHDWLCINDCQAYIGITGFKLTGIRKIDHIDLFGYSSGDIIRRGEPLLSLHYHDYVISVHSPMDCRLLEMNCAISNGEWQQIIAHPESAGWLFRVELFSNDKRHLTSEQDYRNKFHLAPVSPS